MITKEILQSLNKEELINLILQMSSKIERLLHTIGLNSGNSSRPPSKNEVFKKPTPKSFRTKSEKKSGGAGFGLLFHVIVQKYCDHLPLYRQSKIFLRKCIYMISRSTIVGWLKKFSDLLEPLVDQLKSGIFTADHIHSDDTPVNVMGGGFGITKKYRHISENGRPYGNEVPPAVCYTIIGSPDRKGEKMEDHLAKLNETNLWKYLRKVLLVIQDYNSQKLSDLPPSNTARMKSQPAVSPNAYYERYYDEI
jgi:hypothetical protein